MRSPITRAAAPSIAIAESAMTDARETPSASAIISSASSRRASRPAAVSESTAAPVASLTFRCLVESSPPLVVLKRGRELIEITGEDGRQSVLGHLHAVIGHAVLGKVVGADLLRALAAPNLREA